MILISVYTTLLIRLDHEAWKGKYVVSVIYKNNAYLYSPGVYKARIHGETLGKDARKV